MLVVKSKPAREKQPVRAALHLISRQHEKAFREGRVSLTVISSSTLLKPDRSRPPFWISYRRKKKRKAELSGSKTHFHISHSKCHTKYRKIEICQEGLHKALTPYFCILTDAAADWKKNVQVQVQVHSRRNQALKKEKKKKNREFGNTTGKRRIFTSCKSQTKPLQTSKSQTKPLQTSKQQPPKNAVHLVDPEQNKKKTETAGR